MHSAPIPPTPIPPFIRHHGRLLSLHRRRSRTPRKTRSSIAPSHMTPPLSGPFQGMVLTHSASIAPTPITPFTREHMCLFSLHSSIYRVQQVFIFVSL